MNIQEAIRAVMNRRDLGYDEMSAVMRQIMTGEATNAQIGGFLVGLQMKRESVPEIAAAAEVMRELATKVRVEGDALVDICGTGGDGADLFNVSTGAMFIVAAAGGRVAKHGNRSVSSSSGSADLLEAAGAKLDLDPEAVGECVDRVGVGFMFAPRHHSAMRHAVAARREMAVRTIFNLLGPLTNPAGARRQLLGVFADHWVRPLAEVLQRLGSERVMVVHSEDGLDEVSIAAPTHVAELDNGVIREYTIRPEDFGLASASLDAVKVHTAVESLDIIRRVYAGEPGPAADMLSLNAGASIYCAGLADSVEAGVERARAVLADGAAGRRLEEFVHYTNRFE
ncbi:anthranilate phosphoribosyltransferase [Arhodomonas aquaeolei]|uniref:anthranilate phosphoribosyltransferase n=1 Tax=Arhodomonas aquaeolei TaxID=2369 RepID=UPI002167ED11|nr:anthranilate phosphoribosyltransferase [Arhodomonas aquaeolei]MCS4502868.1 anthranilate phosphoribosyltransferase [Arhodomonas aquaeolei]